jgi:hypothetical protein
MHPAGKGRLFAELIYSYEDKVKTPKIHIFNAIN